MKVKNNTSDRISEKRKRAKSSKEIEKIFQENNYTIKTLLG